MERRILVSDHHKLNMASRRHYPGRLYGIGPNSRPPWAPHPGRLTLTQQHASGVAWLGRHAPKQLVNHLSGGPLVVLTLSLVVFVVHVPVLIGFTVARYASTGAPGTAAAGTGAASTAAASTGAASTAA